MAGGTLDDAEKIISADRPVELFSAVDADTGETVLHAKRVPEGFSVQIANRAGPENGGDYLSTILTAETASILAGFLTPPAADRPVENSELREAMDWLGLLARPVVGARRGSPAYQQSRNAALLLTEILRLRAIGEVR